MRASKPLLTGPVASTRRGATRFHGGANEKVQKATRWTVMVDAGRGWAGKRGGDCGGWGLGITQTEERK